MGYGLLSGQVVTELVDREYLAGCMRKTPKPHYRSAPFSLWQAE
jgi:hypothetical protein